MILDEKEAQIKTLRTTVIVGTVIGAYILGRNSGLKTATKYFSDGVNQEAAHYLAAMDMLRKRGM